MFYSILLLFMMMMMISTNPTSRIPGPFTATISYDKEMLAEVQAGRLSMVHPSHAPKPLWYFNCAIDPNERHEECTIRNSNGNYLSVSPGKAVVLADEAIDEISTWILFKVSFHQQPIGWIFQNKFFRKYLIYDEKTNQVRLSTGTNKKPWIIDGQM